MSTSSDRYVVISSDCHAGADILDYRDYLEKRYVEQFDEWAANYKNPFADLRSADASRNWDSDRRLHELESDGVVGEVLFPNTIPPFFPSNALISPPPAADDFELRWAGLKAHNRWMADFCAAAPGRRAGIAQILLNDIDAAVAEVQWVAKSGLTGGVLLPGTPPDSTLPPLIATEYEPLWAACEEYGVPVNHHSGSGQPSYGMYPATGAMFILETSWFAHRALWQLIFSGVFERHPGLRFVLTEQGAGWIPQVLDQLDYYCKRMKPETGNSESRFGGAAVSQLSLLPSEYWARQCYAGASFFRVSETPLRHEIGIDRIMWGADYPHLEGTTPYSKQALQRTFAGIDPVEVRAMVGANAAEVYDFDLDMLEPIAAKVGPTTEEIFAGLDDIPSDAKSPAFERELVQRSW